jgi:hypothetical protein
MIRRLTPAAIGKQSGGGAGAARTCFIDSPGILLANTCVIESLHQLSQWIEILIASVPKSGAKG